jgi:hypothetical protein
MIPERPDMPRTRTVTQSVPGHEVLLVFSGDTTAERFADWIGSEGWEQFARWHDEMEHGIEHYEGP